MSSSLVLPSPQTFEIVSPIQTFLARIATNPPETTAQFQVVSRDLASEGAAMKSKIQKARLVVGDLQDIRRTTEEQEVEIDQLEEKIRGLDRLRQDIAGAGDGLSSSRHREQQGMVAYKHKNELANSYRRLNEASLRGPPKCRSMKSEPFFIVSYYNAKDSWS